jgi:hypothetical protein
MMVCQNLQTPDNVDGEKIVERCTTLGAEDGCTRSGIECLKCTEANASVVERIAQDSYRLTTNLEAERNVAADSPIGTSGGPGY